MGEEVQDRLFGNGRRKKENLPKCSRVSYCLFYWCDARDNDVVAHRGRASTEKCCRRDA